MTTIKIAGVPEHFNYPWKMCIANGEFESQNIDLEWIDVPEGTGKLCELLRSAKIDIAVILTEGILKDILDKNHSKIVQIYVESPLIWGIHVAAHSKFKKMSDLQNAKIAISRPGSGSQLMAFVNAKNQNWETENLHFEIVNTIDGAVDALKNERAGYFLWEKFMTKPLVDQGVFRRLGECHTPWPSFVIAVRNEVLSNNFDVVSQILAIINQTTSEFKDIPNIDITLAAAFDQKLEDIQLWLSLTKWSQSQLSEKMLVHIQNQLFDTNIINKKGTFATLIQG